MTAYTTRADLVNSVSATMPTNSSNSVDTADIRESIAHAFDSAAIGTQVGRTFATLQTGFTPPTAAGGKWRVVKDVDFQNGLTMTSQDYVIFANCQISGASTFTTCDNIAFYECFFEATTTFDTCTGVRLLNCSEDQIDRFVWTDTTDYQLVACSPARVNFLGAPQSQSGDVAVFANKAGDIFIEFLASGTDDGADIEATVAPKRSSNWIEMMKPERNYHESNRWASVAVNGLHGNFRRGGTYKVRLRDRNRIGTPAEVDGTVTAEITIPELKRPVTTTTVTVSNYTELATAWGLAGAGTGPANATRIVIDDGAVIQMPHQTTFTGNVLRLKDKNNIIIEAKNLAAISLVSDDTAPTWTSTGTENIWSTTGIPDPGELEVLWVNKHMIPRMEDQAALTTTPVSTRTDLPANIDGTGFNGGWYVDGSTLYLKAIKSDGTILNPNNETVEWSDGYQILGIEGSNNVWLENIKLLGTGRENIPGQSATRSRLWDIETSNTPNVCHNITFRNVVCCMSGNYGGYLIDVGDHYYFERLIFGRGNEWNNYETFKDNADTFDTTEHSDTITYSNSGDDMGQGLCLIDCKWDGIVNGPILVPYSTSPLTTQKQMGTTIRRLVVTRNNDGGIEFDGRQINTLMHQCIIQGSTGISTAPLYGGPLWVIDNQIEVGWKSPSQYWPSDGNSPTRGLHFTYSSGGAAPEGKTFYPVQSYILQNNTFRRNDKAFINGFEDGRANGGMATIYSESDQTFNNISVTSNIFDSRRSNYTAGGTSFIWYQRGNDVENADWDWKRYGNLYLSVENGQQAIGPDSGYYEATYLVEGLANQYTAAEYRAIASEYHEDYAIESDQLEIGQMAFTKYNELLIPVEKTYKEIGNPITTVGATIPFDPPRWIYEHCFPWSFELKMRVNVTVGRTRFEWDTTRWDTDGTGEPDAVTKYWWLPQSPNTVGQWGIRGPGSSQDLKVGSIPGDDGSGESYIKVVATESGGTITWTCTIAVNGDTTSDTFTTTAGAHIHTGEMNGFTGSTDGLDWTNAIVGIAAMG